MNVEAPINFDNPVRQASAGLWLEAAKALKGLYRFIGLYVLYLAVKMPEGVWWHLFTILCLSAAGFFVGWLQYRSIRFYIDDQAHEFVFQSGVLDRKKLVIRLDRIQQVNIKRHLLQRLLKVYAVEISTAGTEKAEVSIRALEYAQAVALKNRLLQTGHVDQMLRPEAPEATAGPGNTIRLSNWTVLKIALTSRYARSFAILFAFWGSIYNSLQDTETYGIFSIETPPDILFLRLLATSTLFLIASIVVFWVVFNIVTGFVKYMNFRIGFHRRSLQIEFGSIQTNQVMVYADKVQTVQVISNYFQRHMGLTRLVFQQASANFEADERAKVEIPGCTPTQQARLLSLVFEKDPAYQEILSPNYRKMFMTIFRSIVIPVPVALYFHEYIPYLHLAIPLWVLFFLIVAYFSWKHNRLLIGENFLQVREGWWDVSETTMETYKIQGIRVTQKIWHRRAGIGHVTLYTAAENIQFNFVRLSEISPYINRWLYDVEKDQKDWM